MPSCLQLNLDIEPGHRNQHFFSDQYLDNLLADDSRWTTALSDAEVFLTWAQSLYLEHRDQIPAFAPPENLDRWISFRSSNGSLFD